METLTEQNTNNTAIINTRTLKKDDVIYEVRFWTKEHIRDEKNKMFAGYTADLFVQKRQIDACGKKQFTFYNDEKLSQKKCRHSCEDNNPYYGLPFSRFHRTSESAIKEIERILEVLKTFEFYKMGNGNQFTLLAERGIDLI